MLIYNNDPIDSATLLHTFLLNMKGIIVYDNPYSHVIFSYNTVERAMKVPVVPRHAQLSHEHMIYGAATEPAEFGHP